MLTRLVVNKKTNDGYKKMPKSRRGGNLVVVVVVCSRNAQRMASLSLCLYLLVATCGQVQALSSSSSSSTTRPQRQLGLLSFDLDDTLFPTTAVVDAGNAAMLHRMKELGCDTDVTQFLATTRRIRQALDDAPITYTELRKRTIRAELERATALPATSTSTSSQAAVDDCFDVWLHQRNAAAGQTLFPHTVTALQQVQQDFPSACIAAITNGRGNPLDIEPLEPFFDFCVSGEDDGVFPARKPHKGIYEHALNVYRQTCSDHDLESSHVWIHGGDCLGNDVGASAACGAKAVWFAPEQQQPPKDQDEQRQPSWSTASAQDLQERSQRAKEAQKHVAVRIASLAELPAAIEQVLQEVAVTSSLRR